MSFHRGESNKKLNSPQMNGSYYNPPRKPYGNLSQYPASKIHQTVRAYEAPKRKESPLKQQNAAYGTQRTCNSPTRNMQGRLNSPYKQPRCGNKPSVVPVYKGSSPPSNKYGQQPSTFSQKYFNSQQNQPKQVPSILPKKYDLNALLQESFSSSDSDSFDFVPPQTKTMTKSHKVSSQPHKFTREELDELLEDSSDSDFEDKMNISSRKYQKTVPRRNSIVPIYDLSSSDSGDDDILINFAQKRRSISSRDNKPQRKRATSLKNFDESITENSDESDISIPTKKRKSSMKPQKKPLINKYEFSDDSSSVSSTVDLPAKYASPKKSTHTSRNKKTISGILQISESTSESDSVQIPVQTRKQSHHQTRSAKQQPKKKSFLEIDDSESSSISVLEQKPVKGKQMDKKTAHSIIYDSESDTSVSEFIAQQTQKIRSLSKQISDVNAKEPQKKEDQKLKNREILQKVRQNEPIDSYDSNEDPIVEQKPKSILKNPKATKNSQISISSGSSDLNVPQYKSKKQQHLEQQKKDKLKANNGILVIDDDSDDMSSADELIRRVNERIAGARGVKPEEKKPAEQEDDSISSLFEDEPEKQPEEQEEHNEEEEHHEEEQQQEDEHHEEEQEVEQVEEDQNEVEVDDEIVEEEEDVKERDVDEEIKKNDFDDDGSFEEPTDEDEFNDKNYEERIVKLQKFIKSIRIDEEEEEEEQPEDDAASNIDQELNTSLKKTNLGKINIQDIMEGEEEEENREEEEQMSSSPQKSSQASKKSEEAKPAAKKEEAKPAQKKEEAKPAAKKEEAKPVQKKEEAKPAQKKEEAIPAPKKTEEVKPKKEEAKPAPKKEETKPIQKKEEAKPAAKKEEAKPVEKEDEDEKLNDEEAEPKAEEEEEVDEISLIKAHKIKVGSSNTSIQKIGEDVIIERDSENDEIRFSGPPSPTQPSFPEETDSDNKKKEDDANEGSEVLPPNEDEEHSGIELKMDNEEENEEEEEIDFNAIREYIKKNGLDDEEEEDNNDHEVVGTQTPEKAPREEKPERKLGEEEEAKEQEIEPDMVKKIEEELANIDDALEEEDDFDLNDIEELKRKMNIRDEDLEEEDAKEEEPKEEKKSSKIVINDADLMKSNDEEVNEEISANSDDLQTQTKEENEGLYMKLSQDLDLEDDDEDVDENFDLKAALKTFNVELDDDDDLDDNN